jgi:hypothetical protein
MMKNILFYIILFFSVNIFAQSDIQKENLFFDENDNAIDGVDYYKKCNSFLFNCQQYETKSEVYNTIIEIYKFGKLSEAGNKQIRILLSRSTNEELNNKTIIISYRDLIYSFEAQKTLKVNSINDKKLKEKFISSRKAIDKRQKKCIKNLKNKNTIALYMYRANDGSYYTPENFIWHKIPEVVKKIFFQEKSPSMLILKDDGSYFRYSNMTESYVNKFLKNDWKQYINDYKTALNSLQKKRNGFFKKINSFKTMQKFYIDDGNKKLVAPPGTITVRNREEISEYLVQHAPCFSYPIF